jgi:putative transposase
MISRFKVDVLNYMITSNHVHLLLYAGKGTEIEKGMQYLQGRMAQRYNKRTGREGAFWSGRYHATLIENGSHLSQCLFYIDYNMLRAGKVSHPSEWKHTGYHELIGARKRYRIINRTKLLGRLGMSGETDSFLKWYKKTTDAKSDEYMERKKYWTEALAVGSQAWIQKMKGRVGSNRLSAVEDVEDMARSKKPAIPYSHKKSRSKRLLRENPAPYSLY